MSEAPPTRFWHCSDCDFLWKDPVFRIPADAEKARYDTHNNGDEGHRRFLAPVVELVVESFPRKSRGLDWGSGPVPVLAEELSSRGFEMSTYDPFYQRRKPDLSRPFHFITMTEVIEHVFDPAPLLRELKSGLADGGKILVMTEQPPNRDKIGSWWYRRDPTHVSFFSEACLGSFGRLFGLELVEKNGRIFVFRERRPWR